MIQFVSLLRKVAITPERQIRKLSPDDYKERLKNEYDIDKEKLTIGTNNTFCFIAL